MIKLLNYLFVESCRICGDFISEDRSATKSVCNTCWAPLLDQEVQIDLCAKAEFGALKVAHAVTYDERMKLLIHKLKYSQDRLIALDLTLLLIKAFEAINNIVEEGSEIILVPIPLSRWRKIQRGFNQAELLAKHLQQKTNSSVSTDLLLRSKHTKPQHKLNKQDRASNLKNAFKCINKNVSFADKCLVLVDDIHTSGSTLAEAAKSLEAAGAKQVAAITVARALLTSMEPN